MNQNIQMRIFWLKPEAVEEHFKANGIGYEADPFWVTVTEDGRWRELPMTIRTAAPVNAIAAGYFIEAKEQEDVP